MIQNIKVKDFTEILLDKVSGYENYEILSIGKVQGKADGYVNPYVIILKNALGKTKEIFVPSFFEKEATL